MTSNWTRLIQSTCSWSEQKRRENNGSTHRETVSINAEIAGDNGRQYIKRGKSVDTKRFNAIQTQTALRQVKENVRLAFGPRLVKADGSALYQCQCK